MTTERRDVTVPTRDGITLKGWFFPAGQDEGPCVIMTPGLTTLDQHVVDNFALEFQKAGFHALLYEHRAFITSDGQTFDVDPIKDQDDYLDVYDFAATLPEVDAERMAYWGSSYSGGVAICAAAIDPRIKAVIVQAPFVSGEMQFESQMDSIPMAIQGRNQGSGGGGGSWPFTRVFASFLYEAEIGSTDAFVPDNAASQDSQNQVGNWEEKITPASLLRLLRFEPIKFIHRVAPRPLLMILGEMNASVLTSHQLRAFERAQEPKQLHVLKGCGSFGPHQGAMFEENVAVQVEFLTQNL
ncbi:Thiohydrolase [Cladobotryum mycophilum]|uniref:Thiohydrolase n=1 Tax=Cladobotryum mycophilum TaxID=491253 RepID=A0ABR0SSF1_9HYPO